MVMGDRGVCRSRVLGGVQLKFRDFSALKKRSFCTSWPQWKFQLQIDNHGEVINKRVMTLCRLYHNAFMLT